MQFTRYLYLKDEVELSLLCSLLNKDEKESIYWASELFYSGFISEMIHILWKIYYDLYASLNHSFRKYLFSKLKPSLTIETLHNIIGNFLIRPLNTDILFCKIMSATFDFEFESDIVSYFENEDYLFLCSMIINDNNNEHWRKLEDKFNEKGINLNKEYKGFEKYSTQSGVPINIIKAAYILFLINKSRKKNGIGKNLFIELENQYDFSTIQSNLNTDSNSKYPLLPILPARDILRKAHLTQIDHNNHLSLFELKRDNIPNNQVANIYYTQWEYYSYETPFWNKIMKQYDIKLDTNQKKIIFMNDEEYEKQEEFYNNYGLDTDELPINIINKCIGKIHTKHKWINIYNKFKGIVEIDKDYIDDISKFKYI